MFNTEHLIVCLDSENACCHAFLSGDHHNSKKDNIDSYFSEHYIECSRCSYNIFSVLLFVSDFDDLSESSICDISFILSKTCF